MSQTPPQPTARTGEPETGQPAAGTASASPFREFAARWLPRVEAALEEAVPGPETEPTDLHRAMRHAMFPGGKRLRPMLALVGAEVTGGDPERALRPAAALELLHTYSLVHDDLPCMDDDDLRRGRPTCHKVFGDALAVLAGDALLTLAFELVADGGAPAVVALARAAGSVGMVGGQAADIAATGSAGHPARAAATGSARDRLAMVRGIHDRKTGALITASLEVGALAGTSDPDRVAPVLPALRDFGALVGRAFQVADDLLDETSTAEELGKQPGQDAAAEKLTYPSILGLVGTRAELARLAEATQGLIPMVLARADEQRLEPAKALLQDLAHYSVNRRR